MLGKIAIAAALPGFKTGFHMIADSRSQNVLRSSAIIWKHTSAIVCDPAIVIADDRKPSQKIEPCSIFCDRLRSFAIVCDRLRSIAIVRSYGNQSSATCDRNLSHNIMNSDPRFNASQQESNCLFVNMTGVEQGNFNNEEL